jgi:hypothetical protein
MNRARTVADPEILLRHNVRHDASAWIDRFVYPATMIAGDDDGIAVPIDTAHESDMATTAPAHYGNSSYGGFVHTPSVVGVCER